MAKLSAALNTTTKTIKILK